MAADMTQNSNNGAFGWQPDRYGQTTIFKGEDGPFGATPTFSSSGSGVSKFGQFPSGMGSSAGGSGSGMGSMPTLPTSNSNPYGSSGNQTNNGINLGQFDTLAGNQQNRSDTLLGNFGAQQSNFLNSYGQAVNNLPDYLQQYDLLGQKNNLPQLQQNANMLNTALANVPQTYTQAVRGSDTNANQLQQIIGRKAYELSPAVTSANNALSTAQNATQQQMQYSEAQQQKQLTPYATEAQMLPQLQATQAGVFSSEQGDELQGLIYKINSGVQLSNAELDRANQLAIAKMKSENDIKTAQIQGTAAQNVANIGQNYIPLAAGQTLYNTSNNATYRAR